MDTCPICNTSVKSTELAEHLIQAHPNNPKPESSEQSNVNEDYWKSSADTSTKNKSSQKRADIRKEKEQQRKHKQLIVGIAVAFIVIIAVVAGILLSTYSPDSNGNGENGGTEPNVGGEVVPNQNNEVRIPLSSVDDGEAHYYFNNSDGVEIKFFVLKSSDDIIRAAFDACDVCFEEKKGYYQDGDEMVCRNCGLRFPSIKINVIKGGCNPAPLNRIIDGTDLLIMMSDIESGKKYF
jgi:uncharacterized membrane protein